MRRIAALAALALSTAVAPAAHATGAPAPAAPSATAKAADAGPTPAADDLTPAEAPEVEKESQDLAAERAAEQKAGLLPSPAEVAGSALDDMRGLGAVSPLRLNVGGALDPLLGDDLFCRNCPGPAALVGAPGVTGLDAIDLRVARHLFDIPMVVNDEVRELVDYFAVGPGIPTSRSGSIAPVATSPSSAPSSRTTGCPTTWCSCPWSSRGSRRLPTRRRGRWAPGSSSAPPPTSTTCAWTPGSTSAGTR